MAATRTARTVRGTADDRTADRRHRIRRDITLHRAILLYYHIWVVIPTHVIYCPDSDEHTISTSARPEHAAELAPNARATPLIHALACRSSHAAAPELLGDMQRPPWHEIIDEQTCADPAAANMKASVMSIC